MAVWSGMHGYGNIIFYEPSRMDPSKKIFKIQFETGHIYWLFEHEFVEV